MEDDKKNENERQPKKILLKDDQNKLEMEDNHKTTTMINKSLIEYNLKTK